MNRSGNAGIPSTPKSNEGTTKSTASPKSGTVSQSLLANPMVATNESIKSIAESIGISNINEEATKELASDLTFIVKSILTDTQKFARRSRRKKIVSSDIDHSLKARSIEPIYGFTSTEAVPFRCAASTGGNGSGRSIYYTEEHIVDLNDLIAINNQSVKIPNDFAIHAHWLAIEGVQPSVPENPQLITKEMQKRETVEGFLSTKPNAAQKQHSQHSQQKRCENMVKLKSLIPHDLSVEQQIYFKEVTEACVGSDEQKRTEALNSLSSDPGLHQLLSRLILFISEGVRLNIIQQNMPILIYLMRMAKSLSENKSIYLEKYLHELIPSVLSCVLSKQVCARPEADNHCALREFCARLVGQVVKTYSPTIPTLQTRIIKIYLNSLQSEQTTFATLFGAISGLTELGNEICESFIFPLVKMVGERVTQILDSPVSHQEKLPAEKVKQQLIRSITLILKQRQTPNEHEFLMSEFGAYFGPLIHAQLMKLRGTQQTSQQAQSAANVSQRTVIAPQSVRPNQSTPPNGYNQPIRINQATLNTSITTRTIPQSGQVNSLEINSQTTLSTTNSDKTNTLSTQVNINTPSTSKTINLTNTSTFQGDSNPLLNENSSNGDFISKTITASSIENQNGSQIDLKIDSVDTKSVKTESVHMSVDNDENIMADIKSELTTVNNTNTESNHNLSGITSDSNTTNNMTTSDVNLSDNVDPNSELL